MNINREETQKNNNRFLLISILIVFLLLQHIQIMYSNTIDIDGILLLKPRWLLMNLIIILFLNLLIMLLSGSLILSLFISNVLITILSIANYYTVLYHGSPFFAADFYNIATAHNVLGGYRFTIDPIIMRLLALFSIEMILWLFLWKVWSKRMIVRIGRKKTSGALFVTAICLWLIFFSPFAIVKNSVIKWTWVEPVQNYGYEVCFMNSLYALAHKCKVPEGYDASAIEPAEKDLSKNNPDKKYPNIIVILNESLCNLNVYSDIPEAEEALDIFNDIPGIISGYSVSSLVGGGTNNSEYELLTSNSMNLLNMDAPFNYLALSGANSLVSYLKSLGFSTTGMHCGMKSNYSRNRAYYDLGFDNVFLGYDDFSYYRKYGNRAWFDIDNYKDMLKHIDLDKNKQPQFVYLLTYQNHGGYEQNDSSYDKVSVRGDFGSCTDDIAEYLTSVQKSAEAFKWLTEYWSKADEDTVILMVGDHAPSFIKELPMRNDYNTELEKQLGLRTVPYYIWSNTKIDRTVFSKYTSMTDLVPLLLESAGMPLSDYYQTIVDLQQTVPVRTSGEICRFSNGKTGTVQPGDLYYKEIRNYYFKEYNNIRHGKDYRKELFE